jgi:hypothetical protein
LLFQNEKEKKERVKKIEIVCSVLWQCNICFSWLWNVVVKNFGTIRSMLSCYHKDVVVAMWTMLLRSTLYHNHNHYHNHYHNYH